MTAERHTIGLLLTPLAVMAVAACAGDDALCGEGDIEVCMTLRVSGTETNGELGFRFGSPLDVDGDGIADLAAGARYAQLDAASISTLGTSRIWSGSSGEELLYLEGEQPDALFGHAVIALGSSTGDPVIVTAAPLGSADDHPAGILLASSARTGEPLWRLAGKDRENLGWDLASAGDQNGDGVDDLFAGAPSIDDRGRAYLIDGDSGTIMTEFASEVGGDDFGSYVSAMPDMNGDGKLDLLVSATNAHDDKDRSVGEVTLFGSIRGELIRTWQGIEPGSQFGRVTAGLTDINGDGVGDVAIAAPGWEVLSGVVFVYSGLDGTELRKFAAPIDGENYGRMIAAAGDADGDGVEDIAIGAPWHASNGHSKAGLVEIWSGASGELLFERTGQAEEAWFGWHMASAQQIVDGAHSGILISSVRSEENGQRGNGALELFAYPQR